VALVVVLLLPARAGAVSEGTIKGRVLAGDTTSPQAGVRVRLQGGGPDAADDVTRFVTTGADGRYSFSGLPTGDDHVYVVDAFYQGGMFAGRALRLPSDTATAPVIDTTLKVWDTTTDATVIALQRDDMFAISNDDGIGVVESVSIVNSSDFAYIGRGGGDDTAGRVPSLGFALPEGAEQVQILDSNLDIPRLVAADFGFATTVAIPPGPSSVTFSYALPDADAQFELSRNALYPTAEMSVYTKSPLTLSSNRLVEAGEQTIKGTVYNRWTSEEGLIDSGDPIQILVVADAGRSTTLYAGVGAFALVVLVGTGFALRARAGRRRRARPTRARQPSRDEVLTQIATLDLAHDNGELDDDDWNAERARLKSKLEKMDHST
jgi:hypothetical protein